ncbi:hemicentin-2-like isoform X4 [Oculina patagonica]
MVAENGTEIARGNSLASYVFTTTTENDFGKFNCSSENPHGKAEYMVELRKADEPQIRKYQRDPVRRRLTKGGNVTFHCDVISGSPKPEVTWWFGWTDTTKKVDINYDPRYSHPTEETWTITGVDTNDAGKYRCRAKNIAGEAFLRFEITDVDTAPKINKDASPTPVYSFVGNRRPVTVTCSFYGYPVPTVVMADENGTEIARGNSSASKTFNTTTESDFGMYNCSAHSPVGSAQYLVELKKAATLPNTTLKVQPGRNVQFSCQITAGESFVAWITPAKAARPGKPGIPSVSITTSQTTGRRRIAVSGNTYQLLMDSVTVDDGGEYICQRSTNLVVFTLQVDFSTAQVDKEQEIHLGRKAVIKLDVSSYPLPTYEWKKDGKPLTFPAQGKTLDPYTGSITIDNVKLSDQGNYTCNVTFGTYSEVKIKVTVIDEPQIRKDKGEPVRRRLTQGNNVTFHCDVISGSPKPEVTWWFGWTDTTKKVDINYDPRYSHPTEETWTITGIDTQDAGGDHAGKYRCRAANIAGEDFLKLEITHVDAAPKINKDASPTPVYSFVGNRRPVTVTCSFYGHPVPTVVMADENGTEIARGNSSASKTFNTTTKRDFGMYNCSAYSPAGSAQYLVELKNAATLPNTTLKVQPGRNVQFSCQITAGESFVAWITPAKAARPGKPGIPSVSITTSQTTGRRRIAVSGNTYQLLIDSVTVDDGGEYICQRSTNLVVFTLQVDFSTAQVDKEQEIHLGRKAVIKLDVSSYPLPTYEWKKDGKPLTFPAQGKTLDPYTGSITIDNVQLSDQGNYNCNVTFGRYSEVKIKVTVIDEPQIRKDKGEPVRRRLTQGNNVTFHCDVISGSPKPEVTWWFGWTDTTKKVDINYDPRYSHPTEETWTITGIDTQDAGGDHAGKYRCRAANIAGEDFLKLEITHVDVPPTIDPLTDIIANDGDSVDLECLAAGTPTPIVEWFYRGSFYAGQTNFTRGDRKVAKISFPNVHLVNTGEYTCHAKNGALDGNDQVIMAKESMNLYVKSAPKINKHASPTPVYSFVGNRKPVTVMCSFYGYPVPTVVMADKNGTEIARGNGSASKTFDTTTKRDFGMYNCSANSPDGSAQYLVEFKKAVAPGPPRNVAANKTCKEITLNWQPPLDNGGMQIVSYTITVLLNGSQLHTVNTDGSATERTIGYEFMPKTTYEVRLKARSEAGFGREESVFVTINKYMYCTTRKPFITNTAVEVDTEFTVTWSAPRKDSDNNNTKYRLEWRKKPITNHTKLDKQENINETRFRITGLEHNAEYEVRLYAVYRYGVSAPDVRTFKTKVGKPSEILNLQAVATCNSITLTWKPPKDDGGMPINKYALNCTSVYEDITRDISGDNTSYTINGLKYNTKYSITLRATNKAEWGLTSSVEVKTTKYCAPERPVISSPSNSSTLLTTDSFTLKWRRPEETGGDDDITYTVRYSVVSAKNSSLWITKTVSTKKLQLKITRLDNKVQYKFEVTAKNKGGESSPDERFIQTNFTGEGSSQSRLVSSAFLTILVGGLSLLL